MIRVVFCVAKLESMQIKAALFVLNDILTELSDLSRTFQKSDITPMEAQAVACSKIAKLQAQYFGEQKHWSVTVQNLNNKSALTMDKMAPVVRFIERLCTHLKDRFPEDNKLCNWCIFDFSCIKQANFNFGLNELLQLLKQFNYFFHCYVGLPYVPLFSWQIPLFALLKQKSFITGVQTLLYVR